MKYFKKLLFKCRLLKLMKTENDIVRKYCCQRDWVNTSKWLHNNKATFKAYRRVNKLK